MVLLHSDDEESALPRSQAGPQPQRLLLTLLGGYWYGETRGIPSAALVRLLEEFSITEPSARTALSRLSVRGMLDRTKKGRQTFYALTPGATASLGASASRYLRFAAEEQDWGGVWTSFAFSVPEDKRWIRPVLRKRLRWAGYAPLYDGLWVCPHPDRQAVREVAEGLELDNYTLLDVRADAVGGERVPLEAWDLDELRGRYVSFIEEYAPLRETVMAGAVNTADSLRDRTRVMQAWSQFPGLDPNLPSELLPADWPRGDARTIFVDIFNSLGPLAELRFQQLLAEFDPDLARHASHHDASFVPQGEPES